MGKGLFPSAADLRTGEGGGGAAAFVVEVGGDAAVDDGACGVRAGGLEAEGGFSDLVAVEGEDGEGGELRPDCRGFGDVGFWGFGE